MKIGSAEETTGRAAGAEKAVSRPFHGIRHKRQLGHDPLVIKPNL